ncbi:MAG: pilus assembly protein PilM [Planctomycetota bacterium]|nr:pilus assembly protein PilM [Planctomycetota bacterium]
MSATQTWFEKFKRAAMSVEAGPFTAVDFDRQQIRIVFAEHRGLHTRIRKIQTLPIPEGVDPADPQAVGEILGKALRASSMRGKGLVMGVPRGRVVLQPLRLPPVADQSELPGMVRFQVEKELAFQPDEAVIDFAVEPHYDSDAAKGAEDGVQVLVAAVKRPVVEHYAKIAQAARMKLLALNLRPYADTACLNAALAKSDLQRAEPPAAGSCLALVHVGAEEAEINVILDGALAFSRSMGVKTPSPATAPGAAEATPPAGASGPSALKAPVTSPAASPSPAPAAPLLTGSTDDPVDSVVNEFTRTLKSYQAVQRERRLERVLVVGGTGSEAGVARGLQARLGIPATLFDPAEALGLTEADGNTPAFTAALGLALGYRRPAILPFDFLNPKRTPVKRDYARIRRIALGSGVAAALLLTIGSGMVVLWKKEAKAAALEKRIAALQVDNTRVVALTKRVRAVEGWTGAPRWIDQVAQLSASFPTAPEVYIAGFRTNNDGSMSFSVKARSEAVLTELGRRLREAGYDYKPGQISTHDDSLGYNIWAENVKLLITPKVKIDLATLTAPARPADDISAETPREKMPRRGRYRRGG